MLLSIQYLRGIAALLVVYLHTTASGIFGSQGVDIFFVISGFIMAYIMNIRSRTFKQFLSARMIRIVPFYYVITFIVLILGLSITTPDLEKIISSFLFLSNEPIIYQGWTLGYEIKFYFLCAFSILLFKQNIYRMLFILIILLFLSIRSFYHDGLYMEFCFGIISYYLWKHIDLKKKTVQIMSSILIAFSFIIFIIHDNYIADPLSDFTYRAIYYGIPSMLIVLSLLFIEKTGILPKSNFLKKLGDSSYSLYLTHGAVLYACYQLFNFSKSETIYFDIMLIGISIIIGWYSYILIEKPLLKHITNKNINISLNHLKLFIISKHNKYIRQTSNK